MAATIIPIQLSLTAGDGVTLWAPRWMEDGEEWEAFLGHGDHLYVFPDAAHLAAFIRTEEEHDLADHPSWGSARGAVADELIPDDDHRFDIIGVPELVSGPPDVWSLAELADTAAILRSIADVCDLDAISDVLDRAAGFQIAAQGPSAFIGRTGRKLWHEVGTVVAKYWDTVIEALDGLVATPEVADAAVAAAQAEIDAVAEMDSRTLPAADDAAAEMFGEDTARYGQSGEEPREEELQFWDEVGIDCIAVTVDDRTGWGLRCYLDDAAVFLSTGDGIALFRSPAALEQYLMNPAAENSLSGLDAWSTIRSAITDGEASVLAGPENTYRLDGLAEQLLAGPLDTDHEQLALAVELLTDAATARRDDEAPAALSTATPLGNLVRAVLQPDPDRLPPSPPFDDEVAAWQAIVDSFAAHLDWK